MAAASRRRPSLGLGLGLGLRLGCGCGMIVGLLIEPLAPGRVAEVIALWDEVGITRPWNDALADIERALDSACATVLVGLEDRAVVATAMVGHDGHRGWVYYLAVRADVRRGGRGRAMMRACESWLRERGVPKLNLMVRGDNPDAVGFYRALGYVADDVRVLSRRLGEAGG